MRSAFISHRRATSQRHSGFTMIEVLVAVGVFLLLLTIILVPLRLAFDSLNIGRAKSEVQQAAQVTMNQMERDLTRAVRILPNGFLPGVTDTGPYAGHGGLPYIGPDLTVAPGSFSAASAITGPCSSNEVPMENLSRIDMILPATTAGTVNLPVRSGDTVVTYYARRQIMDDSHPWDPNDNPIVLFRAQYPFRTADGGTFPDDAVPGNPLNADLSKNRFSTTCSSAATSNREAQWISHNFFGETNLEPLCDTDAVPSSSGFPTAFAAHAQVTPKNIALVADKADEALPNTSYVPETTFVCEDTNHDGSIDRVTVNLILANYSAASAISADAGKSKGQQQGQIARLTRTIDCPNAS